MMTKKSEPRILTRHQAAEMVGLTLAGFDVWVRKGIIPAAIEGTRRWDRDGINAALDRASGISRQEPEELDPFRQWERDQKNKPVRNVNIPEWSEHSLAAPLGKREIAGLTQIFEAAQSDKKITANDLKGCSISTLSKMEARGLLVETKSPFQLILSEKGVSAYLATQSDQDRARRVERMKKWASGEIDDAE